MNRPYRILVVDDEDVFRSNIVRMLMMHGFEVGSAEDGVQALEALAEEDFDVVLLDLKMPGIGGVDVLRSIKQTESTARIIVLTGHVAHDTGSDLIELGAFDSLIKPVEERKLLEAIKLACEERDLMKL